MPMVTEMNQLSELNYESFLADAMRDYLDYLDHLGFSTVMQVVTGRNNLTRRSVSFSD